jgi:transcriptional regulator with XRE-family HTH domain
MDDAQAVREYIAAEVRAQLGRKRLSVREAARRLGWGQTFLHRRAIGEIPFQAEQLAALADLLEVPVSKFFEAESGMTSRYISAPDLGAAA